MFRQGWWCGPCLGLVAVVTIGGPAHGSTDAASHTKNGSVSERWLRLNSSLLSLPDNSADVEGEFKGVAANLIQASSTRAGQLGPMSSAQQPMEFSPRLVQVSPRFILTTPLANPDEMLTVEAVEVVGSTILSPRQIRQLIEPVLFRRVTRRQLQDVADAITRIYVEQGYITSRAVVVEETIPLGKIRIDVIEGRLADIQITGNRRLSTAYIRSRLKLADKVPLNVNALEEQLRLLRATPYIENIEATLRPSEDPQARAGDSILLVKVLEDKQPLVLGVGFDNYIPPSISQQRGLFYLGYQNISGIGDEIFGSYTFGLTPSRFGVPALNELDLRYRVPINPMDGTIQVRLVATASQITDRAFEALDINAISGLAEFSFRQPIIRSVRQELALSTGFTYQISQTFTFAGPTPFGFGPDRDGSSRTSVLKFGVDYTYRDTSGVWLALSQFNLGLPIFNATLNGDGPFPGKVFPDGRFLSWQAQGLRLQNLGNDFLLILRGDVQLATRPLLAQHQFVIGGGQSVRGYRQNARSGDNGMRISAEFRIPAARDANGQPFFYLTPFIEFGRVWNNRTNPNVLTTPNTLAGAGIGFLWTPVPGLDVRFDAGVPIIYNRDRGFDMQDYGLYFSVVYRAF